MEDMTNMESGTNKNHKVILIVVLLLGAVIFGSLVLMNHKQDETKTQVSMEQEDEEKYVLYDGVKYKENEHLSNYLFLGIDTKGDINTEKEIQYAGQADAIYLISYDRMEKTIQGILIPRDTMTEIEILGKSGNSLGISKDHINIQYAFGDGKYKSCELMKNAVSNLLYQTPIQGYCAINLEGIPLIVEQIGNLEIVLQDDSLAGISEEYIKGSTIQITPERVEKFVRYRDVKEEYSTNLRLERQKNLIQAYMNKVQEIATTSPERIIELPEQIQEYMITNISKDIFLDLMEASYEIDEANMWRKLPGEDVRGEEYEEYHVNEDELYSLILEMFYERVDE